MKNLLSWPTALLVVAIAGGLLAWQWWQTRGEGLPDGIASGNGRIEAVEVDIAAEFSGRVRDLFVTEGDMVEPGQVLVIMDTTDLEARLDRAQAALAEGLEAVSEAEALLSKARADQTLVEHEYERTLTLVQRGLASKSLGDEKLAARDSAAASVRAAEARLRTLGRGVEGLRASVRQLEVELGKSELKAPVVGRVLYKLTQKGEVLGIGGKALTLLDLSNVYMEIFLPAADAGVLQIGDEARILLDIAPEVPLPATVTFVSPQAQFTPKQVETRSEREKLMFRVKLQLSAALVVENLERVKTGLRGIGYVRLDSMIPWPVFLEGPYTELVN